jgi:hypothetical protein
MEIFDDNNMDWADLCDIVQRLRWLGWSTALDDAIDLGTDAMIWFEDIDGFRPVIKRLGACAAAGTDPEIRRRLNYYAEQYRRVHGALIDSPRKPTEAEVVKRYRAGEIGERTARYVMGWQGPYEIIEACQRHRVEIGDE